MIAKDQFLSNMSHEIRTPMNGILGFINLLNEPNLNKSQISTYSAIINKSGDRLLNTINDIIDISKIEAGELQLEVNPQISDLIALASDGTSKRTTLGSVLNSSIPSTFGTTTINGDLVVSWVRISVNCTCISNWSCT